MNATTKITEEQQRIRDQLFSVILKCQRNWEKIYAQQKSKQSLLLNGENGEGSFLVDIDDDVAYVEGRPGEVYIETYKTKLNGGWVGTACAAANKLALMGAKPETISWRWIED